MQTVTDAANYVASKAQELTAGASHETNKAVAKDSNADLGTRASAGIDAIGDKLKENKHAAEAEVHKESAKH